MGFLSEKVSSVVNRKAQEIDHVGKDYVYTSKIGTECAKCMTMIIDFFTYVESIMFFVDLYI